MNRAQEARLQHIAQLNAGRLAAEKVLEDAKSTKSPLHELFDWDNTTAGHQWRLQQARVLIHSVKVEFTVHERVVRVPRYVRDPEAEPAEQGYREVSKIRTDKDMSRDALNRELTSVTGALERASGIAVALGLESDFNAMLDRVRAIRERVNLAS